MSGRRAETVLLVGALSLLASGVSAQTGDDPESHGPSDAREQADESDARGDAEPDSAESPGPTRSAPEEAERHLGEGRALYLQLDFPAAIESMSRVLALSGATEAQRLEAYEYLGASYLVMGREAPAREAFEQMLRIDPYHALREPSGSPKIRAFVEELRAERVPDAALDPELELVVGVPEAARAGDTVSVEVRARGAEVASVRVRHRSDEEREWSATELAPRGEGRFEGAVPTPTTTGRMLLFAEARDGDRRVVGRAGEPHWPLEVDVRDELPKPLVRQWWLWTVVGVAVVGLGVGLGVGLSRPEQAPSGTLPPGRVELP